MREQKVRIDDIKLASARGLPDSGSQVETWARAYTPGQELTAVQRPDGVSVASSTNKLPPARESPASRDSSTPTSGGAPLSMNAG